MNQQLKDLHDGIQIFYKTKSNGHGDARPLMTDETADLFLKSLRESDTPFDAEIGVVDSNILLCLNLIQKGYENLTLILDQYPDKTRRNRSQQSEIKEIFRKYPVLCKKLGIKFKSVNHKFKCDVIVGLTPFGPGSRHSLEYLNKLGDHCKDLRLITTSSVTRDSFMNKVRLDLGVKRTSFLEIPKPWKRYRLSAVFTEWSEASREVVSLPRSHKDWSWVNSITEADACVIKDGTSAGKVILRGDPEFGKTKYSAIYIKASSSTLKKIKGLSSDLFRRSVRSGDPQEFKHCYKWDVVRLYTQTYSK